MKPTENKPLSNAELLARRPSPPKSYNFTEEELAVKRRAKIRRRKNKIAKHVKKGNHTKARKLAKRYAGK